MAREITCPNCGDDVEGSTEKPYCSEECASEDLDDGFDTDAVKRQKKSVLDARDQDVDNALYKAQDDDGEVRVKPEDSEE